MSFMRRNLSTVGGVLLVQGALRGGPRFLRFAAGPPAHLLVIDHANLDIRSADVHAHKKGGACLR